MLGSGHGRTRGCIWMHLKDGFSQAQRRKPQQSSAQRRCRRAISGCMKAGLFAILVESHEISLITALEGL